MAAGVERGDEVLTTSYSFFATAGVITRLGARPVFVDIDSNTFNLDVTAAGRSITPRTKAIMPVHLFGESVEMGRLVPIAAEQGIAIIEDAAQAIGTVDSENRMAGTTGLIGCYSFFPTKNLGAFGDGGMAVTNDEQIARRLRMLRTHGSDPKYFHKLVGGNFRLDALQAAVLRVKLKYLSAWTSARRSNADRYRLLFKEAGLDGRVGLPPDNPGHTYHQFVIRVDRRDALRAFLRKRDVETEVYYPLPLHLQECFRDLGYRAGDFPHAERAASMSLALPIYPELSTTQQEYVVRQIREFLHEGEQDPS
jgi:dTDP-4-amino-4,6-dideoxygalactose transaminase